MLVKLLHLLLLDYCIGSNVDFVDPMIGTKLKNPKDTNYGGMIPSVASPFAMTRWTPTTRQNYVGKCPYEYDGSTFHGFQATHQPAVWMGESAQFVVCPGAGKIKTTFDDRVLLYSHVEEISSPHYYKAVLSFPDQDAKDTIKAEMSAVSRAGVMRFTFDTEDSLDPFVSIQITSSTISGEVSIDPDAREIYGWNPERQDSNLGPFEALNFKGYFVAKFEEDFASWGTANNSTLCNQCHYGEGTELSAFVTFPKDQKIVNVRLAVSYISVDQARQNLNNEIPEENNLESTAAAVEQQWAEKLNLVQITNATEDESTIFYTAMYHALQVCVFGSILSLCFLTCSTTCSIPMR